MTTPPPTPSTVQLERATANALWPSLRRHHWQTATKTRAISPTGNPNSHGHTTAGHIPGPEPTIELLEYVRHLTLAATSQETRLGVGLAIELTRDAAYAALANVSHAAAAEYQEALEDRALRFQRPFTWKGTHYRRNERLPRRAALALQAIAAAATVRILTPEEDASLLEDHGINAAEVFVAIERAEA